jgi:hypothetical protein
MMQKLLHNISVGIRGHVNTMGVKIVDMYTHRYIYTQIMYIHSALNAYFSVGMTVLLSFNTTTIDIRVSRPDDGQSVIL